MELKTNTNEVSTLLNSSLATYPTSNAKSLACNTANAQALETHAAAVRQLSKRTSGDDLYIYTYSNGR